MTKKATNLSRLDKLVDGAIVLHSSIQLEWVYIKAARTDGRIVTRRYRHDAMVEVIEA